MSQGIEEAEQKPLIRMDQGSANMAYGTRRLIRDLEMVISPARVSRPTDNGRQERLPVRQAGWYRTVKLVRLRRAGRDLLLPNVSIGGDSTSVPGPLHRGVQ